MHHELERNDDKRRSFARMYGESVEPLSDLHEFVAKAAEVAKKYNESHENVYNDSEPVSELSVQDYIDAMVKCRKIDPNQAFIEHKNKAKKLIIDEIMDSLTS